MGKIDFVEKPNLPIGKVKSVILSERYTELFTELTRIGVNTIASPPADEIEGVEKYHADISVLHIGGKNIICAKNNSMLIEKLRSFGFNVLLSENDIVGKYPNCTALNAVVTDKGIICRKSSVDNTIRSCFENRIPIINVNQGYARCSSAVVSDNAIITSDEGIYRACIERKIDVLKISSGGIEIEGYDYGFIGGCCGKLSYDMLAFCGKIEAHRDYFDMKAFASDYGVNLISLSNKRLFDVGGMLPVLEETDV